MPHAENISAVVAMPPDIKGKLFIGSWRRQNNLFIDPVRVCRPVPPPEVPVKYPARVAAREAAAKERREAAANWRQSPAFALSIREESNEFPEEADPD